MTWRPTPGTFLDNVLFGLAFALGWKLLDWLLSVVVSILNAAR